ncbi:MAG: putative DNA binding domain-containing protein [Bacteroidales bacterium]|nr:putative DNA binding domain-containing protein [Bacteroidales bacterium]
MDIHETFNDLRYHYEDEAVEFKKAENNFDFDDLGKYFSALSNEANLRDKAFAWIVFGVHDKSREVLGTSFKNNMKSLQKLKQDLSQHTTDNNTFREIHELKIDGKRVLMFQIPAAPRGIPMAWKGHFYGRRGESLVALDMSKYEEIRRQVTDVDWSKQIVEGATIDDLYEEAIAEARKGFKEHYPKLKKEVDGWNDEVFLNKAKLTIGGKITRTAILLLGKPESVHYLDHIGEIVWRLAGKDNVGQVFSIPFLLTTTEVMHKIRNYPFKIFPNESFLPGEGMKYDTETILEALHNCIAHQDYTQNARIIVIERENELEFSNSGRFFEGTYEDYITGERIPKHYRNPFLAQAMANIKMIDTEGFGIHKMFVSQKDRYLPMPDYDKSDNENVVLTLPGNVIDENYSLLLLEHTDIDLTTAVLLDRVQKGKPLNGNAIKMLRKEGLIEGRKPHLYVSKRIAKATNLEVEYTLKKGFDDAECQQWIIKALKDHTELSRKQINELLWSKLPIDFSDEQKITKIGNLLTKMRKQDLIRTDKDRLWHLSEI